MSFSLRWSLAVLALAGLVSSLHAQARPFVAGGPATVQNGVGPLAFGGLPAPVGGVGLAPVAGVTNPYALSTVGGYNPYLGTGSLTSLSPNTGYGLSTLSTPFYSPFFPPPFGDPGVGLGYTYQGIASMTQAAGQYQKDIQQARITREYSRQAAIDTARRRIEFELWKESIRPTYAKLREKEQAVELDLARDAQDNDITSGKALNTLLRSIQNVGTSKLNRGPQIDLAETTLKNLNLSGGGTGNVGLLKNPVLAWTEALTDDSFKEPRLRFTKLLRQAADTLKDREEVPERILKDLRADYKTMSDDLDKRAIEFTTSQYIEARKYLNQLNAALRALSDPNTRKHFDSTWAAKGRTVALLIEDMTKDGLTFNAATPGNEAAYRAMYRAMQAFESGLQANK